jgi:hypothetical protein
MTASSATATQTVELKQLIPLTPPTQACWVQVEPPLAVIRIGPLTLPAKQTLAVGQLIARSALPLELGYCQLQLPPNVKGIPTVGGMFVDCR